MSETTYLDVFCVEYTFKSITEENPKHIKYQSLQLMMTCKFFYTIKKDTPSFQKRSLALCIRRSASASVAESGMLKDFRISLLDVLRNGLHAFSTLTVVGIYRQQNRNWNLERGLEARGDREEIRSFTDGSPWLRRWATRVA